MSSADTYAVMPLDSYSSFKPFKSGSAIKSPRLMDRRNIFREEREEQHKRISIHSLLNDDSDEQKYNRIVNTPLPIPSTSTASPASSYSLPPLIDTAGASLQYRHNHHQYSRNRNGSHPYFHPSSAHRVSESGRHSSPAPSGSWPSSSPQYRQQTSIGKYRMPTPGSSPPAGINASPVNNANGSLSRPPYSPPYSAPVDIPPGSLHGQPQLFNRGGSSSPSTVTEYSSEEKKSLLFPEALFAVLEDAKNYSWIRWDPDGKSFRFNNYDNLLEALTRYGVRARMKPSVSKNLNDYQFQRLSDARKRKRSPDSVMWHVWKHPEFQRDRLDLIKNMVRRKSSTATTSSVAATAPLSASSGPSALSSQSPTPAASVMVSPNHHPHHHPFDNSHLYRRGASPSRTAGLTRSTQNNYNQHHHSLQHQQIHI
ncbi:hypothetical protein H4219_001014 [Mycoemilia scoparia]|uniref:HSF-type DNA-binding domain-containing protein n=1 Tax=Mycoemilia scoparia TaxID=417184 RepID=A0A9W8AAR1_9FUNG|nr:hypothetical protein H4219_001014 [Mycoemilia scoparia]